MIKGHRWRAQTSARWLFLEVGKKRRTADPRSPRDDLPQVTYSPFLSLFFHASDAVPFVFIYCSYDIHKAHRFKCLSPGCDMVYSRHSKKGIDVGRHRCGQCQGRLEYVGAFNIDGSRKKEREANGFSLFVKENFDAVKIQMSAVKSKKCVINLDDSRDKNIDLTYSGYSSSGSTDSRGRAKKSSSKKTLKSATPKMTDVMKKLGLMYKEMNVGGQTAAAEEIV